MNETVTRMKYGLTKSLIKFTGPLLLQNGKKEKKDTHMHNIACYFAHILPISASPSSFQKEDEGQLF